jgi:hypothetical protein
MSDPFNILGETPEPAPRFEEAVRDALARLQETAVRFEALYEEIPEEAYTDEEWRAVEAAAEDLAASVERAEEGYVAVMYDSSAWYRIMESLEAIHRRLESAMGLMERARDRAREAP